MQLILCYFGGVSSPNFFQSQQFFLAKMENNPQQQTTNESQTTQTKHKRREKKATENFRVQNATVDKTLHNTSQGPLTKSTKKNFTKIRLVSSCLVDVWKNFRTVFVVSAVSFRLGSRESESRRSQAHCNAIKRKSSCTALYCIYFV